MLTDAEWEAKTVAEKRAWLRRHVQRAEQTISTWQPSIDNLDHAISRLRSDIDDLVIRLDKLEAKRCLCEQRWWQTWPQYTECVCERERSRLRDSAVPSWWCPLHGLQSVFPQTTVTG